MVDYANRQDRTFDNISQKYSVFSWQWARMILELIIHGSGGAESPVQNAFSSNAIGLTVELMSPQGTSLV